MTPVAGDSLPVVLDEMTYRRVVMGPGATGDYFPGHYDPEYARAQGQPTIYANSLQLFALVDRTVLEWAGPTAFVVRRAVQLRLSLYAGDTATVTGIVGAVLDGGLVDVTLVVMNQHGEAVCEAAVTVRLG